MSLYVKASCGNCKSKFEIYHSELQKENGYRCPHCFEKMADGTWQRLVDAFMTASNLNSQTLKASEERGSALFSFEFVSKEIPSDKIRG